MKGKKTTTRKSSAKTSKSKKKSSSKSTARKSPTSKKKTSRESAAKKKTASKKKQTKKKTSKKQTVTGSKSKSGKSSGKNGASPATSNGRAAVRESKNASSKKSKARSVAEVASSAAADDKGYVFINGRRVRMISTQGLAPARKSRAAAAPLIAAKDEPPRLTKTTLTRKELKHFRELLLIKRAELFGDLSAMEAEALRSSGGNISHMPIHMADIGTDTYDQDFMLGLAETERRQLREIDDALERIQNGTYGICQMTGQEIPKARLEAKPWAKYTIEAARLMESQTRS